MKTNDHALVKMEALSSFMEGQKDIKKVYILGQNYSHGVQVAKYAKETLARKRAVPAGPGTMPTHTPLFVVLLIGVVILVGALTFVPALALGPVVEHLQMTAE